MNVSAVWQNGTVLHLLEGIEPAPFTPPTIFTVDWVRNSALWVLGGLLNAEETPPLLTRAQARVSTSPVFGEGILPPRMNLPDETQHFYVHLSDNIRPPGLMSDWQLNQVDEVDDQDRTFARARTHDHCILTGWPTIGDNDTHEVAHVIAKHSSPTAFQRFALLLFSLEIGFPRMDDLRQVGNLAWLCKHVHGSLDRESWAIYIAKFCVRVHAPYDASVTSTLEVHHFKEQADLLMSRCPDPLRDAIVYVNEARALSPPVRSYGEAHSACHPSHPPLAYLYTPAIPTRNADTSSTHPHPVLWRIHYAVACGMRWGTPAVKALVLGRKTPDEPQPSPPQPRANKRKRSASPDGSGNSSSESTSAGGCIDGTPSWPLLNAEEDEDAEVEADFVGVDSEGEGVDRDLDAAVGEGRAEEMATPLPSSNNTWNCVLGSLTSLYKISLTCRTPAVQLLSG
ncbi:hypothetical protein B0H17DRAFT_1103735, partial [Mycena rosella]